MEQRLKLINESNSENNVATILSKFELRFNAALNLINSDLLQQEVSLYATLKRKKRETQIYSELVLFSFLLYFRTSLPKAGSQPLFLTYILLHLKKS